MIDALLLGTSGTFPLPGRPLSSMLVRVGPELLLFDCGEGTQVSMRRAGWGFKALSAICLSHLHADHVSGLPGLLLTVGHSGRREPLDIYGPPGTRIVVAGLRVIAPYLPYEVRVHELAESHRLHWNGASLSTLPIDHAIPCLAYRVDLPRTRRFDADKARALDVPIDDWKSLQRGETVLVGNEYVTPEQVLGPPRRGLSLAFVTDTRPTTEMPHFLAGVDLLTIEGTYGDPTDADNALENKHLLFSEAAEIGRRAGARQIWLTHFSAKMLDPERYLDEATRVHPDTAVGYEGLTTTLRYSDE